MKINSFRSLISVSLLVSSLFGCEKTLTLEPMIKNPSQILCINGRKYPGFTVPDKPSDSLKKTLIFRDEFNGREQDPGDETNMNTPECYNQAPACIERLDWSVQGTCSTQDFSNLRDLNKCKWSVWDGYSFWENSKKLAYSPTTLSVSGGNLNITFKVRPGEYSDCGPGTGHGDGYGRDCKVYSGGIDSNYRSPTTKGYNFKEQRVEMRASVPATNYIWPALWTWNSENQNGFPYSGAQGEWDGEYDILELVPEPGKFEALQTYHTWRQNTGDSSTGAKATAIKPNEFHRYGIDRYQDAFLFYIDDCYTRLVRDGDSDTQNNPNRIKVDNSPQFMMMSMGYDKRVLSDLNALNGSTFKIDYVRVYQ